jgi:hypothetical protein
MIEKKFKFFVSHADSSGTEIKTMTEAITLDDLLYQSWPSEMLDIAGELKGVHVTIQSLGVNDTEGTELFECDLVRFNGLTWRVEWAPEPCSYCFASSQGFEVIGAVPFRIIGNSLINPEFMQ